MIYETSIFYSYLSLNNQISFFSYSIQILIYSEDLDDSTFLCLVFRINLFRAYQIKDFHATRNRRNCVPIVVPHKSIIRWKIQLRLAFITRHSSLIYSSNPNISGRKKFGIRDAKATIISPAGKAPAHGSQSDVGSD